MDAISREAIGWQALSLLKEGQLLSVHVQPAEFDPMLSDEARKALEESWDDNEVGYCYLAGR